MNQRGSHKLSAVAMDLIDAEATQAECYANVVLENRLTRSQVSEIVNELIVAGARELDVRFSMSMVHMTLPVASLRSIAGIKQVQWVDIEKSAKIESVLDS